MMFHEEAIADDQKSVLEQLGPVAKERGFYLAGGTAIALHLGHRRSVDFDWFRSDSFSRPMEWAQALRGKGIRFDTTSVDEGTLHGTISRVRISFFEYKYPLLSSPVVWTAYDTHLASLDDLACMKLVAIAQRGTKKDFVDLYALCEKHRLLSDLINRYQQKYQTDDIAHLLYALTYFDDAEAERMPVLLWDIDWQTVKHSIRTWVKDMAR